MSSASVDREDWLDKVLEQYWKQRHGMYNANQDDVDVANREAKDAIANKIVTLVLKDRTALKQELKQSLEAQLKKLADEYDLPSITTWKQGEFIDMPRYNIQGPAWKREQELRERTLVRPGGGTNNALFQVCGSRNDDNIVAYICAVPKAIEFVFQDKGDNRE